MSNRPKARDNVAGRVERLARSVRVSRSVVAHRPELQSLPMPGLYVLTAALESA